jgi:hypothetical protein
MAELMERGKAGRVRDVHATIGREEVRLEMLASEEPVVELWEANKQIPLFESIFGRKLELAWVEIDA